MSEQEGEQAVLPEWPQLAALAQLPQPNWTDALSAQIRLNCRQTDNATFQYTPIEPNQIRLLFLMPASSPHEELAASMVVCNFPTISLDGWHALSYTWGNPHELAGLIIIDGHKMKITANLDMALRDVRNEDAVPYWVDAVCINQADLVEKAHQIRHMRFIYERATHVRAWLGGEDDKVKPALQALKIYQFLGDGDITEDLSRDSWSNATLEGFLSLLSRPYWQRIWILQEIVCGSSVSIHCGRTRIPIQLLERVHRLLARAVGRVKKPLSSVPLLTAAANAGTPLGRIKKYRHMRLNVGGLKTGVKDDLGTTLLGLLRSTRSCQASDPRDRIFALLGLVEDIHWTTDVFPIDYQIPVEQLFTDVTRWIIVHSECLDLLLIQRSLQTGSTTFNLPTWCPDWTVENETNSLVDLVEVKVSALTDLYKPTIVSFYSRSMTVEGVSLDRYDLVTGHFAWESMYWYQFIVLTHGSQFALQRGYSPSQQAMLQRWLVVMSQNNPALIDADDAAADKDELVRENYWNQRVALRALQDKIPQLRGDPILDERLEKLWQTLTLHVKADSDQRASAFRSMFNVLLGWADESQTDLWSLGWEGRYEIFNFTGPFRRWVAACCHGRQVAVTEKGYLGFAPVHAQKGDVVCCLHGCQVPLVLRPEGSHYLVIGEAYVHGYMALEIFQEVQNGVRQETSFTIH